MDLGGGEESLDAGEVLLLAFVLLVLCSEIPALLPCFACGVGEWREGKDATCLLAYLEHAMGSSHDPGTDCTTMFDSLTPDASSLALVPARRGSIIAASGVSHVLWEGGGVELG